MKGHHKDGTVETLQGRLQRRQNGQLVSCMTSRPEFPQYTADELEFMMAVDQYKRDNQRPHPTWCEVLAVAKSLGYRKVVEL